MQDSTRSVLLIAYHFPPCSESSGYMRTLCFARDLRGLGWRPDVLTATVNAYDRASTELYDWIPPEVRVHRALAFDTQRHLSIKGRYLSFLALPDRLVSWLPAAVMVGVAAVLRHNLKVVWSTYPLATSHIIGYLVARLTGRPWIADFRDPMVEFNATKGLWAPSNKTLRDCRLWVEKRCMEKASALVYCTEGARRSVIERYGDIIAARTHVIPNGYDEDSFAVLGDEAPPAVATTTPYKLLHSGTIYPTDDRDPSAFFAALARLKAEAMLDAGRLKVMFRASGQDAWLAGKIAEYNLADMVQIGTRISYHEALRETCAADGLLVFQGYTSNPAIPAKVYEYIRSGRPIFAMVDHAGDTAALLARVACENVADLRSVDEIYTRLKSFVADLSAQRARGVPLAVAQTYARHHRATELAALLDATLEQGLVRA